MPSTQSAPRIHAGEPVAVLLLDRLHVSPLKFGLVAFVLSFVIPLCLAAAKGRAGLDPTDDLQSFLESPTTYFYRLLMIPLASVLMLLIYQRGRDLYRELRLQGVIRCSDEVWRDVVTRCEKGFKSPVLLVVSVILAALAVFDIVHKGGSPGSPVNLRDWSDLWGIAGIYNVFFLDFGMYYFSAQVLFRVAILLRVAGQLFHRPEMKIQLDLWHPDGRAGLRPIRRLSDPIHFFILLVGLGGPINLWMGMATASEPIVLFLLISYVVLGSLAFFAPLLIGRDALLQAWDAFRNNPQPDPPTRFAESLWQGERGAPAVFALHAHWESLVQEPFRLRTLGRYLLCVAFPMALVLLIEILKYRA